VVRSARHREYSPSTRYASSTRRRRSLSACCALLCVASCGDEATPQRAPSPESGAGAPICTECGECESERAVAGAAHVEGNVDYTERPPSSGDHHGCWATWGYHESVLPAERWVHNLEHGGVALLHHCPEGCDAALATMRAFADASAFALVTPYPEMPEGFAFVAWGQRLMSTCFDAEAMRAFYSAHADRAPESVSGNPPAECSLP